MKLAPARVCLVGLRCAGKSSVARLLGERLGWPVVDLDPALVAEWNRRRGSRVGSAGELLQEVGVDDFRRLEAEVLAAELTRSAPLVLATGGGCVETAECRRVLVGARTFWLDGPVSLLAARLRADAALRPSLTGGDSAEELALLAERRAPLYREVAEARFDAALSPDELARRIAERLASPPSAGR